MSLDRRKTRTKEVVPELDARPPCGRVSPARQHANEEQAHADQLAARINSAA
jgi:hypothetical protein